MENKTISEKESALREMLDSRKITEKDSLFTVDKEEYLVLTDEEAQARAEDYILSSVWAFRYEFLADHSEIIAKIPK